MRNKVTHTAIQIISLLLVLLIGVSAIAAKSSGELIREERTKAKRSAAAKSSSSAASTSQPTIIVSGLTRAGMRVEKGDEITFAVSSTSPIASVKVVDREGNNVSIAEVEDHSGDSGYVKVYSITAEKVGRDLYAIVAECEDGGRVVTGMKLYTMN